METFGFFTPLAKEKNMMHAISRLAFVAFAAVLVPGFISVSTAADNLQCEDYEGIIDLGPVELGVSYEDPDLHRFSASAYAFAKAGLFEEAFERAQVVMDLYDSGCGGISREMYNPLNEDSPHRDLLRFQSFTACSQGNYVKMVSFSRDAWGTADTPDIGRFINKLWENGVISGALAGEVDLDTEALDAFLAEGTLKDLNSNDFCTYQFPIYEE